MNYYYYYICLNFCYSHLDYRFDFSDFQSSCGHSVSMLFLITDAPGNMPCILA